MYESVTTWKIWGPEKWCWVNIEANIQESNSLAIVYTWNDSFVCDNIEELAMNEDEWIIWQYYRRWDESC